MVMTARAVVCLCLCLSVCQIRGSHISVEMNRTIQNLLQHYNVPLRQLFKGEPVFSRDTLSIKTDANRVFMLGVLDTYEKLLGQMLKDESTPSPQTVETPEAVSVIPTRGTARGDAKKAEGEDVQDQLNFLLTRIKSLRRHHYQEQEKILQRVDALRKIKTDDRTVQFKALYELTRVYEQASSLPNDTAMQARRRRRQTRRVKTQARG